VYRFIRIKKKYIVLIALNAEGLIRYAQIYYICERGCNAHIVRFPQNEEVTKINPRGVDFRNRLKISQTNNVCVAPNLKNLWI